VNGDDGADKDDVLFEDSNIGDEPVENGNITFEGHNAGDQRDEEQVPVDDVERAFEDTEPIYQHEAGSGWMLPWGAMQAFMPDRWP
jgi:hypothetical protein